MAEKYFPNVNPIGRKLRAFPWGNRPYEIVEVVANTRTEALTPRLSALCSLQLPIT